MNTKILWGMAIDLDVCSACGACVEACLIENNIAVENPLSKGRQISWMNFLEFSDEVHNELKHGFVPRPCMQCENPICVSVCPVEATAKDSEGIVGQIYHRCIGCRYCMAACPYGSRNFNWSTPKWNDTIKKSLNPDVSVRQKGVVEKCNFCHQRLKKVKERAIMENREFDPDEFVPACVQTCPTGAIIFGNIADPETEISKIIKSDRAFILYPKANTKPKVYYLTSHEWLKEVLNR